MRYQTTIRDGKAGQAPDFRTPAPAMAARQEFPYIFLSHPHTGFR
jgi:hypothetical protein